MIKDNPKEDCSTQGIVTLILENTPASQRAAWHCIQKNCFPKIKGRLYRLGVDQSQIEELLYDAGAELFHNILRGVFKSTSSICTYYFSIVWNMWKKLLEERYKKKSRNTATDGEDNDVPLIEEIERYLAGQLTEEQTRDFEKRLQNDTYLQELVEFVREAKSQYKDLAFNEEMDWSIDNNDLDEPDAEETKTLLLASFPNDEPCIDLLIEYYFIYQCNFEQMASAIKMKREQLDTAYNRIRKQVYRCTTKFKNILRGNSDEEE